MDNGLGLSSEAHSRPARTKVWPILPLAAIAWWAVGALPWVISGLGADSGGYVTLLPFQASLLTNLLTVALGGGAAAGLATLWLRERRRRRLACAAVSLVGSFVATAYSVTQAAGATRQLGTDFDGDPRVLAGGIAVAVAGSVVGTVLGLLVALGGTVARALATAPLAVATGSWFSAVVVAALGTVAAAPVLAWSLYVVGALVGLALATLGLRPASRLVTWVVVLRLLAVSQAAMTAFGYVTSQLRPGTGLPGALGDLREAGRDVFLLALRPEYQPWVVYVVALAGGLAGALVPWRRRGTPDSREPAVAAARAG